MEKDGRFWPTDVDATPRVSRFRVPNSPLTASEEEFRPGMTSFEITETSNQIEERLRSQFPVYRIVAWGKEILSLSGKENEV